VQSSDSKPAVSQNTMLQELEALVNTTIDKVASQAAMVIRTVGESSNATNTVLRQLHQALVQTVQENNRLAIHSRAQAAQLAAVQQELAAAKAAHPEAFENLSTAAADTPTEAVSKLVEGADALRAGRSLLDQVIKHNPGLAAAAQRLSAPAAQGKPKAEAVTEDLRKAGLEGVAQNVTEITEYITRPVGSAKVHAVDAGATSPIWTSPATTESPMLQPSISLAVPEYMAGDQLVEEPAPAAEPEVQQPAQESLNLKPFFSPMLLPGGSGPIDLQHLIYSTPNGQKARIPVLALEEKQEVNQKLLDMLAGNHYVITSMTDGAATYYGLSVSTPHFVAFIPVLGADRVIFFSRRAGLAIADNDPISTQILYAELRNLAKSIG